jgi:Heterokaryon incompatibility protein (HET)
MDNQSEFFRGIKVGKLPKTFQDAINFARRLNSRIQYIWIDSLCIVQDDRRDWARESVQMYQIYRNSYCNISATGAKDNDEGLYFKRNPEYLWEDQINLNAEGIPKLRSSNGEKGRNFGLGLDIRRCNILDASFWAREVDNAHINQRGWVLQERLLAPRVLHFCHGQIAWECRQIDAAECLPHGVPSMELREGDLKVRARSKTLIPDEYGPKPLNLDHLNASDCAHEGWKRIVERYSVYELTKQTDKLIALAGIAEMMSRQISGLYVAGMWEKYLASQLLWRVDPVYENSQFKHPSQRPNPKKDYQAPSFSWAAIKAPQGIKCGETRSEEELFFTVQRIHTIPLSESKFGAVKDDCYIELLCCLKRIEISKVVSSTRQYSASLRLRDDYEELIYNLYLDSPEDDFHDLVSQRGNTFCVPAYEDANFLICLILQLVGGSTSLDIGVYRRVGVVGVPWKDSYDLDLVLGCKQRIRVM